MIIKLFEIEFNGNPISAEKLQKILKNLDVYCTVKEHDLYDKLTKKKEVSNLKQKIHT